MVKLKTELLYIILPAVAFLLVGCRSQNASEERRFIRSIKKDLPFKVDSLYMTSRSDYVEFHFANKGYIAAAPDIEISSDGKAIIYRTTALESLTHQYENVIWRNVVVTKKHKRVVCIDRYLKQGRTEGYVYVFQTEKRKYPSYGTYHWDVSDSHHIEFMGSILNNMEKLAVKRLHFANDAEMMPPTSQDDYWRIMFHADSLYDDQQYDAARQYYDLAFTEDKYILPYHLTTVARKMMDLGDEKTAIGYLTHRMEMEKDYYEDPSTCPFTNLNNSFSERQQKWGYDLRLKEELEDIFERDNHDRILWSQSLSQRPQDPERVEMLAQKALRTDSINLVRISEILSEIGFPRREQVGEFATMTTWIVFQHGDLEHQKLFLPKMEEAVANGIIPAVYLAMLKDRIDVREGRPQKYGTQLGPDGRLCPLLDPSRVNEWRKEVGLPEIEVEE